MRDLYAALQLDPSASDEAIRARLATITDPALREAVEGVLLVPEWRAGYDRAWRAVAQVVALRTGLGLGNEGFGALAVYREFGARRQR